MPQVTTGRWPCWCAQAVKQFIGAEWTVLLIGWGRLEVSGVCSYTSAIMSVVVRLRVPTEMARGWKEEARANGMSLSLWMRQMLKEPGKPRDPVVALKTADMSACKSTGLPKRFCLCGRCK